mgnify:CR=1 FL=1
MGRGASPPQRPPRDGSSPLAPSLPQVRERVIDEIDAGIGGAVARQGYDSISARARTTGRQKLGWLGLSLLRSGVSAVMPKSAVLHAPPVPEVAFLVEAAACRQARFSRSEALFATLSQLEAKDRAQRPLDRASA